MHTAHLETVCASVSLATTKCHSQGRGSPTEQVWTDSSDHPKIVISTRPHVWCPGGLCSEIQCIRDNGYMGPPDRMIDGQTQLKTLPSRNYVDGW